MVLGLSLSVKLKQYTIVYKEFDTGGVKTFHNSTINKVPRARKGKTSLVLLGVPEIP